MSTSYCCCCFKRNGIIMSIGTKSSYRDGKTLLDYIILVLGQESNATDFICMRCSKALQVAYHFINMVNQSKKYDGFKTELKYLDNSSITSIQHEMEESSSALLWSKNERQLEKNTNNCDTSLNELNSITCPSSTKIVENFSQTDPGPFESNKNSNMDISCIICNKVFEDKNSYLEHNRQQHKEIIPFKCKLCSFYTCYTESIRKHYEKVHELKKVAVDFYQTMNVREMPEKNPNFEKSYSCIQCNFIASATSSMDEHLSNIHQIDEDKDTFVKEIFGCPSCYRYFCSRKAAKIHYSMYHICSIRKNTGNTKKFNCEKCGKLFDSKSGLFLHRRICEKSKAVKCNFCNTKFTSVLYYERHLQNKHSVVIAHECEICSKTFNCSEYLAVHRKRHNERNYQCDLCPKNYITNADLKIHKQRKHPIKQTTIACDICKENFEHSALLRYHENNENLAKL